MSFRIVGFLSLFITALTSHGAMGQEEAMVAAMGYGIQKRRETNARWGRSETVHTSCHRKHTPQTCSLSHRYVSSRISTLSWRTKMTAPKILHWPWSIRRAFMQPSVPSPLVPSATKAPKLTIEDDWHGAKVLEPSYLLASNPHLG